MTGYKFIQHLLLIGSVFSGSVNFNTQAMASDQDKPLQEFSDFPSLRTEVLAKFGTASKRIWLATDFLTDAEIVSSLFIAQYRKVNISVLLGKDRATNILSRLNYLNQVNIPVALRPKDFFAKYPTIILIDNQVYGLSITLDYMTRASRSSLEILDPGQRQEFESRFTAAAKLQNAPKMAPMPQVGRSRPNSRYYKISESKGIDAQPEHSKKTAAEGRGTQPSSHPVESVQPAKADSNRTNTGGDNGSGQSSSYRYRSGRVKAPEGVPTRLPKTTLRQELQRERERLRNNDQDQTSTAE